MRNFLLEQGISESLLNDVDYFKKEYKLDNIYEQRISKPQYRYYGKETWEMAISAILEGAHLLLSGPKATGKNVLADNLSCLFNRPHWNVSLHLNSDAESLIGYDTFKNNEVVLRKGPVYLAAQYGGFAVFDEINMAKSECISVIHSALDYRRFIDVPGYDRIYLHPATRFIGTMNYGYIGTRELNEALVSRFLVLSMQIISEENLNKLIAENFPLRNDYIKLFARLYLDLEEKSKNSQISSKSVDLRGLFAAIQLIRRGLSIKKALTMSIINKSFEPYEKQIIKDMVDTLFSDNISPNEIFRC